MQIFHDERLLRYARQDCKTSGEGGQNDANRIGRERCKTARKTGVPKGNARFETMSLPRSLAAEGDGGILLGGYAGRYEARKHREKYADEEHCYALPPTHLH